MCIRDSPDIPAVASVNPGDVFRIECKDWTDGQIKDNDNPQDIADVNLEVVHVLSGPIWVNGAQPGDILVVDILEACLLYTSDAADELRSVDLGGRRIIKKKIFSSRRRHTRCCKVSWARRCV